MRRLKRRTVVAAGVGCGIVLAWVLSPILSSRQTAQATVAVSWPSAGAGRVDVDRYYKNLAKEGHEWARLSLRSNQNWETPSHFQSVGFNRPVNNRMKIFITTEDRRLSQTAVKETVAHMVEWTAEFPAGSKLTVVNSAWDDLPDFPAFSLTAAGVVLGLLAGLIMANSLPHE